MQVQCAGDVEIYKKYSGGVTLQASGRKWSFTGYKQISEPKGYDGGGFRFSKTLVRIQPPLPLTTGVAY